MVFVDNLGGVVRFSSSKHAQVDSFGLFLAQRPQIWAPGGDLRQRKIGRSVSSSCSCYEALPCRLVVFGCGTDPPRTAQIAESAGREMGAVGRGVGACSLPEIRVRMLGTYFSPPRDRQPPYTQPSGLKRGHGIIP